MKIRGLLTIVSVCLTSLVGCASMPDAEVGYYLPKSSVNVTATQTANCTRKDNPVVVTNVSFDFGYSADESKRKTINFDDLDNLYSSGEASFTLTEDGRLQSFNSTATGAGKDAIGLLVSTIDIARDKAIALLEPDPGGATDDERVTDSCDFINKVAGKTKGVQNPLSIVVSSRITFSGTESNPTCEESDFKIQGYTDDFYIELLPVFGRFGLEKCVPQEVAPTLVTKETSKSNIVMVEPAVALLTLKNTQAGARKEVIFNGAALVPQWGVEYKAPIPAPPMFGSHTLTLELHGSGKVKKIKYGSVSGLTDANTAFSNLKDTFTSSVREEADAVKAQADLIKEQQRLIKCKINPSECT